MFKAFIFDMDGVIVDNHVYHLVAWQQFCKELKVELDEGMFRKKYFGKSNQDILTGLMNRQISTEEANELGERKETIYREVYKDHIKIVDGLEQLLITLKNSGKLLAVATSAPTSNLNFVLDNLNIRKYFDVLTDGNGVKKAKPDPEIYLKSARMLNVLANECVVFEDSVSGILAAKNAGMQVVSMLTTHNQNELPENELYIKDFNDKHLISFLNL